MTCSAVRRLIDSFLAGELLVETTHEVLAHLSGCFACRVFLHEHRRLRTRLRGAWDRSDELAPRDQFLASLATQLSRPASRARRRTPWWRRWPSLAAAAVLAAALVPAGRAGISGRRLSALVAAAVGDHENCAIEFRLHERPISLAEAARRYDPALRSLADLEVPSNGPEGPIRVLERHVCVFDGRRFAHLVLGYRSQRISVLVAQGALPGSTPASREANGFSVAARPAARHAVLVVAELDAGQTAALADTVAPPVAQALAASE
jgi:anti-sigma factor RsiW